MSISYSQINFTVNGIFDIFTVIKTKVNKLAMTPLLPHR